MGSATSALPPGLALFTTPRVAVIGVTKVNDPPHPSLSQSVTK